MIKRQKVIWAEGVFLGQQHFQRWDKQIEANQTFTNHIHPSFPWGLFSLSIDEKLLENGRLSVLDCSAILPDGQIIKHQNGHGSALQCDLGGHGGDTIDIFLAQPANSDVSSISGYTDASKLSAWQADYVQLADEYDLQREREVLLASPNLMLLSTGDSLEKFTAIKIAEVFNEGDGSYRLIKEFIPPVLRVNSSQELLLQLGRIIEMISAKMQTLNERLQFGSGGAVDFAKQDPANFALLQTLNNGLPQLVHFQTHQDLHPEPLYRFLAGFMGSLCTFSPGVRANSIPPYHHDDLRTFFKAFTQVLSSIIQVTMPSQAAALKLTKETDALLAVTDIEADTLDTATFFIGVYSDADDPNWITDFARQVKVSSRGTIEMVVASALPGVNLVHTQRPPAKLATKSGLEYFRLDPRGDFWQKISEEQSIAVFLPHNFIEATVELVTVQE